MVFDRDIRPRYWPFSVLPPDQLMPPHQEQITFLETAYREGFHPYMYGSENFGATAGHRSGEIVLRTRRFWQLVVGAQETGWLDAYVSGFNVNAEAVLRWLRGSDLNSILEFVRPHLVPAGGRTAGYNLEPSTELHG
jgi:hypothetical protein